MKCFMALSFPFPPPLLKGPKFQNSDTIREGKKIYLHCSEKKRISVWYEASLSMSKAGPLHKLIISEA